jgi:hypothetical protein
VGKNVRKFFWWLFVAQAIFAVFGIGFAALGISLDKLSIANNFMVVLSKAAP